MRKTALGLALLGVLATAVPAAVRFEAGLLGGSRTVNDERVKAVFGNGTVFYPYATVNPWKGLFVGAGYEGGYSRTGTIGLYEEPASLKVTGFEAFAGYALEAGTLTPYVKAGYARFAYRQVIDSPFIGDRVVDAKAWGPMVGGGLKIALSAGLFAAGEIRFVPLKVKPLEEEADLGGMRYLAGLGLRF